MADQDTQPLSLQAQGFTLPEAHQYLEDTYPMYRDHTQMSPQERQSYLNDMYYGPSKAPSIMERISDVLPGQQPMPRLDTGGPANVTDQARSGKPGRALTVVPGEPRAMNIDVPVGSERTIEKATEDAARDAGAQELSILGGSLVGAGVSKAASLLPSAVTGGVAKIAAKVLPKVVQNYPTSSALAGQAGLQLLRHVSPVFDRLVPHAVDYALPFVVGMGEGANPRMTPATVEAPVQAPMQAPQRPTFTASDADLKDWERTFQPPGPIMDMPGGPATTQTRSTNFGKPGAGPVEKPFVLTPPEPRPLPLEPANPQPAIVDKQASLPLAGKIEAPATAIPTLPPATEFPTSSNPDKTARQVVNRLGPALEEQFTPKVEPLRPATTKPPEVVTPEPAKVTSKPVAQNAATTEAEPVAAVTPGTLSEEMKQNRAKVAERPDFQGKSKFLLDYDGKTTPPDMTVAPPKPAGQPQSPVKAYHYDPDSKTLTVQLNASPGNRVIADGDMHRYGNVTPEDWKKFQEAPSKGGIWNREYRYKPVDHPFTSSYYEKRGWVPQADTGIKGVTLSGPEKGLGGRARSGEKPARTK